MSIFRPDLTTFFPIRGSKGSTRTRLRSKSIGESSFRALPAVPETQEMFSFEGTTVDVNAVAVASKESAPKGAEEVATDKLCLIGLTVLPGRSVHFVHAPRGARQHRRPLRALPDTLLHDGRGDATAHRPPRTRRRGFSDALQRGRGRWRIRRGMAPVLPEYMGSRCKGDRAGRLFLVLALVLPVSRVSLDRIAWNFGRSARRRSVGTSFGAAVPRNRP